MCKFWRKNLLGDHQRKKPWPCIENEEHNIVLVPLFSLSLSPSAHTDDWISIIVGLDWFRSLVRSRAYISRTKEMAMKMIFANELSTFGPRVCVCCFFSAICWQTRACSLKSTHTITIVHCFVFLAWKIFYIVHFWPWWRWPSTENSHIHQFSNRPCMAYTHTQKP